MRQPILQQYYTRAREGVFRSNEGYDTIAKSPQLENGFIKKTLHPFCSYDAPKELQERAEKDVDRYPQALLCFYSESGEMILGQSAYVGADFTGQRNTFFSHNYVIPQARQEEYWQEPSRIVGAAGFVTHYDTSLGKTLPELDVTPYRDLLAGGARSTRRLLQQLGITEMMYKRLLAAVITAISGKKKVFVVPPTDVSEMAEWAKQLLYVLYLGLPFAHRRRFGFLTYMSEPQSRKHLHLMFVPPGSMRPGDVTIEKEYQFDFAANRVLHTELSGTQQLYLDFVWANLVQTAELNRFYQFAEEVLAGADAAKSLNLGTYHELSALYLTERGNAHPYEQNKAAVHRLLVDYLANQSLRQKKRLHSLFMGLFQKEMQLLAAGCLPNVDTLKAVIDYASLVKEEREIKEFYRYLLQIMIKGKERGEPAWLDEVYRYAEKDGKLFRQLMQAIISSEPLVKPLFLDYVDARLLALNNVEQLLGELSFWVKRVPPLREYRAFLLSIAKRIPQLVKEEQDLVGSVLRIYHYTVEMGLVGHAAGELLDAADTAMLQSLQLSQLTPEEASQLGALFQEKPTSFAQELDWTSRTKLEWLLNLYQLWQKPDAYEAEALFAGMNREAAMELQAAVMRRMQQEGWSAERYPLIPFAFYQEEGVYRFDRMIGFVVEQGGRDALPDFVKWSLKQQVFTAGVRMDASYRQALKQYFLREDREALQKRASRQIWSGIKNSDLKRLMDEVRDETANGLVRFFRKPAGKTVSLLVGVVGVGAIGAAMFMGTTKPVQTEVAPVPEAPEPAAPVIHGPAMPQKSLETAPGQQETPNSLETPPEQRETPNSQDASPNQGETPETPVSGVQPVQQ